MNLVISLCVLGALALQYYLFHKNTYEALLIWILGSGIAVLASQFLTQEVSVGVGFGLFAFLSLVRFRGRFSTREMVYIFSSVFLGVLSSVADTHLILWSGIVLIILTGSAEIFLVQKTHVRIEIPADKQIDAYIGTCLEEARSYTWKLRKVQVDGVREVDVWYH